MSQLRLTIRARLTLLYTGLFAACGAIVVAVSYTLVAELGVPGQVAQSLSRPTELQAMCLSVHLFPHVDKKIRAACSVALRRLSTDPTLSHLLEYSLITLGVVIALAGIFGWLLAGRALRPVHQITAAARSASEHNLAARVALSGPHDELRDLADTFDDMLGRLEAAFEGQKRFIANASHELLTPLAVMRTSVDVVLDNPDNTPDDLRSMATDIRAAVDHAEHLVGSLLILARSERGLTVHEEVDLATVAEDVLEITDSGDRRVHATLSPSVITGDPVLAERLITNLVNNAVRYNVAGGDIWISTRTVADSSQLIVANSGPVVNPADAERITQPFQRLRERTSHDGFGLGLTIAASITAIHGGALAVVPRSGGGLSVTATIPSTGAPSSGTGVREGNGPVLQSKTEHHGIRQVKRQG